MDYTRRVFFQLAAGGLVLAAGSRAFAQAKIKPGPQDVLLVVDVQNCFTPGGSLAVKDGDKIIPIINRLAPTFEHVVLTQDWHTPGHVSFASTHPGKKPFETTSLPYGLQIKAGQFFDAFGRINATHPHTWEFADSPIVNGRLLGADGLRGVGAQIAWTLPVPWY